MKTAQLTKLMILLFTSPSLLCTNEYLPETLRLFSYLLPAGSRCLRFSGVQTPAINLLLATAVNQNSRPVTSHFSGVRGILVRWLIFRTFSCHRKIGMKEVQKVWRAERGRPTNGTKGIPEGCATLAENCPWKISLGCTISFLPCGGG